MSDKSKKMWNLVGRVFKGSDELRDVEMGVRFVCWDTVDHLVVWLERFSSNRGNLLGDSGGEQESLSLFGQVINDKVEIV